MRLGLFVATFSGLCAATSLVVPVPYGPRELPGGRAPAAVSPPRCLRLAYDYEQDVYPLLTIVRLHSEHLSFSELWLRADGSYPARDTPTFAMWRPAGPDSMDIVWHHSPVVRLPALGDSLVGRLAPAGVLPLFWLALTQLHDYRAVALPVPCDQFPKPAA
jgi:hypothetical protein